MFIDIIKATLLPQVKETARASWHALGAAAQAGASATPNKFDDIVARKVFADDELFDAFYAELETRLLNRFFGDSPAILEEVRSQLNLPPTE